MSEPEFFWLVTDFLVQESTVRFTVVVVGDDPLLGFLAFPVADEVAWDGEESRGRRDIAFGALEREFDESVDGSVEGEPVLTEFLIEVVNGLVAIGLSEQVWKVEFLTLLEDDGSFECVFQFPDVSGPRIA